ncbi:hypothetical protein PENTCL1PPCAC_2287 [Pristionchus entomophagus]|uniref:Uncharacterized protein n=1 Tax=Pristionchus entomophagus TaxID=358040 RepID=A0AAV5SA51_9BILA|nr:hypothetical protein PENTCL1PPCAC_2287 [Pristionchus entomophagus]
MFAVSFSQLYCGLSRNIDENYSIHIRRMNVIIPSLPNLSCSHVRQHSRWFALFEDVTQVEIPISELPSSSSYTHEAPIGLSSLSSSGLRRSASGSYVPTLADASELGGRDIVDEDAIGSVLGVSSGSCSISQYDFDAMLATVEESNLEQPILDLVPSRDLLPASTLRASSPNRKSSTISPEKERIESPVSRPLGVRSRLASLSPVAAPITVLSITASEVEKKVQTVEVEPDPLPSVSMREGEMNVIVLMDIVERWDMDSLRSLLTTSFWPKASLTPHQVSRIFALVVDQARDCEECREMMRDFGCASPRHSLPCHILLLLAARSAREEGIQGAMEAIQLHHKAFMMAPISMKAFSSLRVSATRSLWREVAGRSERETHFNEMYESGMRMGLLDGSREMVEEALNEMLRRRASFSSIFRRWRWMGERYGSVECGMGTVVRAAMNEKEGVMMDSLRSISSFVASCPSLKLESFVTHLVLNLLSKNEDKTAKHVFSLVSIHGNKWREIFEEIERDHCADNLILIEKIANLITYGVIGEIRKKERKGKAIREEATVEFSNEESMVEEENKVDMKSDMMVMMESIVWKANGGKNERKKKAYKKTKKRVKVDQKEIHDLAERIQKTWMNIEIAMNGWSSEGMNRLVNWSMLHRLAIPRSISHLNTSSEIKSTKRESGV